MMRPTHVLCLLSVLSASALAAPPADSAPAAAIYQAAKASQSTSAIDQAVASRLKQLKITPAPLCSDAVFLRRAYLDVIGTLPTASEARTFLADKQPDKRAKLIDQLIERDEFATYWAMKWSDLLRVKSEFPINLWPDAVQGYYTWILHAVREDMPYNAFARELLCASGSNFYAPEANFYRATQDRTPRGLASAVALTFMGVRAERLPKEQMDALCEIFAPISYKSTGEWKEQIVYCDLSKTADKTLLMPDGAKVILKAGEDPRHAFAEWLLRDENPYFRRAIANRVWYWFLGHGIIHEPDDIRPDNPPSNPELLALLERDLLASNYDLKHLFRMILNSQAYQRSSVSANLPAEAQANFAAYPLRRLDAEVLIDAICQITDTHEKYSSAIPEPFTFVPETNRTIALQDGSINSSFLELFGRSPRDTGQESERANRISAAQRLHLLNSSHIQRKLESGAGLNRLLKPARTPREKVTALYLAILSRHPTEQEFSRINEYAKSRNAGERELAIDVAWALINSSEFLYRH